MKKRSFLTSSFEPRTSKFFFYRRTFPLALPDQEANGVWWLPRSSKPLFRRGSVEGLVRFRRASATLLRRRRVRQKPHLHRSPFVRGVHRLHRPIERHLI